MTLSPMLPGWLLVVIALALLAWVVLNFFRSDRRARLMWVGRAVMVLALVAALARPGVGTVSVDIADESVDVLFVLDMSASSAAEDWDGTQERLEGMVADVEELASQHPGARYSLVTFGSYGVQRLPFTTDASALVHLLERLQPESAMYAQGTSVGAGAGLVEDILDGASLDYPDRARVLYYLGDGEQTAPEEPESFADSVDLIQGGAVFGYGTSIGATMPEYDEFGATGADVLDREGNPAISRLDEDNLIDIADQLDVRYEWRSADSPIGASEVDVGRGQSLDATSSLITTFPLYWVFALIVLAWLLVELWLLGRLTNELRTERERIE